VSNPTKCTPEVTAKLVEAIRAGIEKALPLASACRRAGINPDSFYEWRKRARAGEEPYATEVAKIEAVRAELEEELAGKLLGLARDGNKHQAVQLNATKHLLARLFPEDWEPARRVEVSGPEGGAINLNLEADARLLERLARLAAGPEGAGGGGDAGGSPAA
jgi:transposase-like protein